MNEPQKPLAEPPKSEVKFADALAAVSSASVVALFVLYISGFVIWNAHLNVFGVSPRSLFQLEFISAALCYFVFVSALAVPPGALFLDFIGKGEIKDRHHSMAVCMIWVFIIQALQTALSRGIRDRSVLLLLLIGMFVTRWLASKLAKRYPTAIWRILENPVLFWAVTAVLNLISLGLDENFDLSFLLASVALLLTIACLAGGLHWYLTAKSKYLRGLAWLLIVLTIIAHIQHFGGTQFRRIPRAFGGGRPDIAWLEIDPEPLITAKLTNLNKTNGLWGPILILLESEAALICIRAETSNQPNLGRAFEINRDSVKSRIYVPRVRKSELSCCERAKKNGKSCAHNCCREARIKGLVCTVCNPEAQLQQ